MSRPSSSLHFTISSKERPGHILHTLDISSAKYLISLLTNLLTTQQQKTFQPCFLPLSNQIAFCTVSNNVFLISIWEHNYEMHFNIHILSNILSMTIQVLSMMIEAFSIIHLFFFSDHLPELPFNPYFYQQCLQGNLGFFCHVSQSSSSFYLFPSSKVISTLNSFFFLSCTVQHVGY